MFILKETFEIKIRNFKKIFVAKFKREKKKGMMIAIKELIVKNPTKGVKIKLFNIPTG